MYFLTATADGSAGQVVGEKLAEYAEHVAVLGVELRVLGEESATDDARIGKGRAEARQRARRVDAVVVGDGQVALVGRLGLAEPGGLEVVARAVEGLEAVGRVAELVVLEGAEVRRRLEVGQVDRGGHRVAHGEGRGLRRGARANVELVVELLAHADAELRMGVDDT